MYEIIAKAASVEAMLDKKTRGADGIEWQLIETGNVNVDKIVLPIYNVHTRLTVGEDICIDKAYNHYLGIGKHLKDFDKLNNYVYLIEAMELANWLGETQGFRVNVICHLYYSDFVQRPDIIARWLEELFDTYRYCNILVENSCIATRFGRFKNMLNVDTIPEYVEVLQDELKINYKNRLGSVLDVCHLLSSYRTFMYLVKDEGLKVGEYAYSSSDLDYLKSAFKRYSKTCKTVHFNNCTNLGIKPVYHGTLFSETDSYEKHLFEHVLSLFTNYTKDARMVLEVRENDVNYGCNFETLCNMIRNSSLG